MRVGRLLVLASCAALAATPALGQHPPSFRTDTWTTEDGLPSTSFTGMAQSGDGYLWIATGGNLVRFDGFDFRVYNTATNPIIRDRVNRLYVGIGDTLWIGLDDGTVLSMADGRFAELGRLPERRHWAFTQDRTGTLLVVGDKQLLRWSGRHFEPVETPRGWKPSIMLPDAGRDASGDAWFAGSDGSLLRIAGSDAVRGDVTQAVSLVTRPSRHEILRTRHREGVGEVLDGAGNVIVKYRWNPDIRPILVDRQSRLWADSSHYLLVYASGHVDPVGRIALGRGFSAGNVLQDRDGDIWLSTAGLLRVQEVPFRTITRSAGLTGSDRQLRGLAPGPNGTILAEPSVHDSAIYQFAGDTVRRFLAGLATAWTDARGTTWLARPGEPLTGRRDHQRDLVVPRAPGLALPVAADPADAGTFWFAGEDGAWHADPYATGGPRIVDSLVTPGRVQRLSLDARGTLWAITADAAHVQELVRYARGTVTRWSHRDGLPAAAVRALHADDDGSVWLGLYGGGLVRFANGEFRSLTAEQGLDENVVSCILDDGAGNFWMAGNRGVHRVRRDDAIAFLEGRVPRVVGVSYGRRDGLTDPETTGEPCARRGDGSLWFPTFGGAAVVDPGHALALDSVPPRPHVLGIRTTGDTLLPSTITRLPTGQRRLAFSYTAISLRDPAGVRFEYRLDGVDRDWIWAGSGRIATYNNVGPGNHVFRVRAVNAGGTWSTADATLAFVVPPYFHETIPFYVLLAATLALGAQLLWRARTVQLRHRQAALQALVDARTAELGRTLAVVEHQASQLRTLDEAKSRFFANVSHEFRTPLSLMLGPVEDVRDGRSGALSEAARHHLDTALANGRRLAQLVEQLLAVARLESGTLTLHAERRDVVPLLRRIAESFAALAQRKGIEFRVSVPAGGLQVRHDPDHLDKVVGNLLGNALKFTPAGGRVELRAGREGDGATASALIEVQDTGPGIAPEHQARIFERFFQVDDSARRVHEGAGIGLALARELVELHGGTLSVRSEPGHGATFTVRLPMAGDDAPESGVATQWPPVPEPMDVVEAPGTGRNGTRATPPPGNDDVTTVLVAEDNVDLLAYLHEHLADHYRVLEAETGTQALALAREHAPDLIVSDVMMPEMDGQTLCETIKRDPETDFIPVILLTARASRESRLAGLEGGADDYLAKPVDIRELQVRAANLIASRRRLRERFREAKRELPSIAVRFQSFPADVGGEAFLRKLYAVMAAHVGDEDLQADALATAVDMSRSTLYRRLETLTGKSPMDVLREYRLDQAAQWLTETDANVSEIAYGVGFKSVPHFSAKFRERFGVSPSAYRKGHATEPDTPRPTT